MLERLLMIAVIGGTVGLVYALSLFTTPGRGIMKVLERTAVGAVLCFLFHVLLAPLGLAIPQNPFSSIVSGYLGIPGIAFSTFVSLWP